MRKLCLIACLAIVAISKAQVFDVAKEMKSENYRHLKDSILKIDRSMPAGKFGEFVKGVKEDVATNQKVLAFTFDACGGPHGNGYDKDLIDFLRKEKIPATLFITGLWMEEHPDLIRELAEDTLFEIENHGLKHKPCSVTKEQPYGINATDSLGAAIDEMELGARAMQFHAKRRPLFYRSATAETDEACGRVAQALKMQIVGFEILSGDVGGTRKEIVKQNILKNLKQGAIVIGHFNHPEWNTFEALQITIPELRKRGYKFIKLQYHRLKGR